jgi:hypothetical protein
MKTTRKLDVKGVEVNLTFEEGVASGMPFISATVDVPEANIKGYEKKHIHSPGLTREEIENLIEGQIRQILGEAISDEP